VPPGRQPDFSVNSVVTNNRGGSLTQSWAREDVGGELRFARAVERLHRLGPRSLYQFLAELSAARMIRVEIEAMVDRYVARLDPDLLHALSGDRYSSPHLHLIEITDD
jgi:hypothetical protein